MILNIAFQGGTYGNFLRYFLDKFSTLTPKIIDNPVTKLGTYHGKIKYSNNFEIYHPNCETKDLTLPHCVITISHDDILLLQRTVYSRPGDMNLLLNDNHIIFKNVPKNFDDRSIEKLYGVKVDENTKVPRYILRDFVKLGFSDIKNHGYIVENERIINQPFQNVFWLPVASFWDSKKFFEQMSKLNEKFNLHLKLDAEAQDIHNSFIENIPQLKTLHRCTKIITAIENNKSLLIPNLDLVEEAYIYSWIETTHRNILAPFTNTFFKNTKEITEYIEWYPHFYHGMNPTLPKER